MQYVTNSEREITTTVLDTNNESETSAGSHVLLDDPTPQESPTPSINETETTFGGDEERFCVSSDDNTPHVSPTPSTDEPHLAIQIEPVNKEEPIAADEVQSQHCQLTAPSKRAEVAWLSIALVANVGALVGINYDGFSHPVPSIVTVSTLFILASRLVAVCARANPLERHGTFSKSTNNELKNSEVDASIGPSC